MTKRYFSTDTFKKIFHSEKHPLSLPRWKPCFHCFKHPTVVRQIHTELLFLDCWEAANSIYALTTSRGCHAVLEFWILGYMSGLPHSAATTKALSCLLAPGRDNTEHFESISHGFSTVSSSIVPFVIDLCSFRAWQVLLPPMEWFTDVRALMQICMYASHSAGEHVDAAMMSEERWEKHQSPFRFCHRYTIVVRRPPHNVRSFILVFVVRDGFLLPTASGSRLWPCCKRLSM